MDNDEIKKQLIASEIEKIYQKSLRGLRFTLLQQAYMARGEEWDINQHLDRLLGDLRATDWTTLFAMSHREVVSGGGLDYINLSLCSRCQHHFLSHNLHFCDPCDDKRWGYYCSDCITAMHIEWRATFQSEVISCVQCHLSQSRYLFDEGRSILSTIPGSWQHNTYCTECAKELYATYQKICVICGTHFVAPSCSDMVDLCKSCRTPKRLKEAQRVSTHNFRARELKLQADLTLIQWLNTLDHFGWRCAYCKGAFKGMEHYIPLSLGGGTTVNNCLPSCSKCNVTKKDKHPDRFKGLFPTDNLVHIRVYLDSQQAA